MAKKQLKKTSVTATTTGPAIGFLESAESNIYWQLLIIILVPSLLYLKVINFEFVGFDDRVIIADHYNILGNIKNIGEAFKRDAFLSLHGDSFYRPVQTISFMFDAMVSGKDPWMYHFTNLIIHVLTCITLFFFLKQLNFRNFIALIATLIFSVHPLFASAVSWVPARGDLLIGLFGLLLFISFHKHITSGNKKYFLLHAVLFVIAMFTKETILLFPLMLLFYYFIVLKQAFNIKKLLPYFIVWALALISYLALRSHVVINNTNENILGIKALIENLPVIPITLSKFFLPYNLSTFPLFEGAATITGSLLLILLLYSAFKFSGNQKLLLLFGFLWFLIFTVPGLLVRVKHADARYIYLEHRTYLVMIGMIIIPAVFANYLINSKKISLPVFNGVSTLIIIVFAIAASVHSDDYKDGMAFFSRAIIFNNPSAYTLRGDLYLIMNDTTDAAADFDKAVEAAPDFPDGYYNRGKFEADIRHQYAVAEIDLSKAISLDSGMAEFLIRRAVQRTKLQHYDSALADLAKAVQLDPSNAEIYFRFGTVYFQQKRYKESYDVLSKAIALQPDYADAYNNRGLVCFVTDDLDGATTDYKKAIAIKPGYLVYYNLAVVYNNLQQPGQAIPYFDSCINLLPNFTPAYMGKGRSMQLKNDISSACKNWQQALSLGDATAKDTLGKYCK